MSRRTILAALLALAGAARASDKFDDMTPLLPAQANAATVIDVQTDYNSPLAVKEKWATERPLPFPPSINTASLSTRIDPGSLSGGKWEVGVARLRVRLTMDQIAEREKGAVETVAGAQAVLSPRNAFFVDLRPWIIGMVYPADRQELARWVRGTRSSTGAVHLAPFLKDSVTGVPNTTQFITAIDVADAINPDAVHKELAAAPAFPGKPTDVAGAAKVLGTLHGVKLSMTVTDAIHGELQFAFAEPAAPLVPWAKPLLVEFLAGRGASVEALADWTTEAVGNAIVMRGQMREQGFRRVLSLVAPPAPPADVSETALGGEIRMLATTRYFKTIQAFLDDLQRPSQRTQQDFTRFATWYDSFAQRVEQLPTFNVDEDVAKFGYATSVRLRAIAASLRGDVVDVQKLEQSISITPYIYATSGWGRRLQPGIWLQSNEAEVRAKQQAAIQRGTQDRQDLGSHIENEAGAIQQALAERYKAK